MHRSSMYIKYNDGWGKVYKKRISHWNPESYNYRQFFKKVGEHLYMIKLPKIYGQKKQMHINVLEIKAMLWGIKSLCKMTLIYICKDKWITQLE